MRRSTAALLVVTVALLVGVGPAGAHGDEGVLEVVNAVPAADGTSVTYTVALTYANDGDPVDGAEVTATARRPGTGALQPVVLTGVGPGSYAGTVRFPAPGEWRVTFASPEPVAEAEARFTAGEPASTTTTAAPTTAAPTTTAAAELVDDGNDEDDGGPPAALVLGLVVAGAVLVAAVVLGVLRRRTADL